MLSTVAKVGRRRRRQQQSPMATIIAINRAPRSLSTAITSFYPFHQSLYSSSSNPFCYYYSTSFSTMQSDNNSGTNNVPDSNTNSSSNTNKSGINSTSSNNNNIIKTPLFTIGGTKIEGQPSFKVAKVSYKGNVKTVNLKQSEILQKTSILARDLLSLNLTARQERGKVRPMLRPPTAILPRTDSILLSFGYVRAVASRESVYLFDAHLPVAKAFAISLAETFEAAVDEPPELVFLEAVLQETCENYSRRVRLFEPIVDDFLGRVANEVFSDEGVHQLVPLKDSLQSFELQVKQALSCLTDLINDDNEMLSLLLTEQAQALKDGTTVDYTRHEHVELILGSYARQLRNTLQEIVYLLQRLQSKQEFISIALAGYRNRMVRMNVTIGIASLSLSLGAVVGGIFGMNLINGFEDSPMAFNYVVLTTGAAALLVAGGSLNYLSGHTMQKRAEQRLVQIEALTGALSDMCALDFTIKTLLSTGRALDREEFKKFYIKSRQTGKVSDREIDLLFEIFDTIKDGQLSMEDFSNLAPSLMSSSSQQKSSSKSTTKSKQISNNDNNNNAKDINTPTKH